MQAFDTDLGDFDAGQTLAAVEWTVRGRRAAEVGDLELLGHWADLHSTPPDVKDGAGRSGARLGGDRLVVVGGEGTPPVQEFCLTEVALARQTHTPACRAAMADVLDLRHRLPQIWQATQELQVEVWVARRVASMTRHLSRAAARHVDAALARAVTSQAPSRVFTLAEAKIIEADPRAHAEKVEADRRRRYVCLSRTDETGLRNVIARVNAGDAVWVDAMVERVADLIADRHPEDTTRDVLRAEAFGWLARPAELLQLLLTGAQHDTDRVDETDRVDDTDRVDETDRVDPLAESRTTAFPTELLHALRTANPDRLRPPAVLYVHLHQAALAGTAIGVARVEDCGPVSLDQLRELLGHAQVTVKPVIDLRERVSVNAYEHPQALRERVWLTTPGDCFPYAAAVHRRVDLDHVRPFQPHGPPGQTSTHNTGPLGRRHHRLKTHGGYECRQLGLGRYLWRTPHGRYFLVDSAGTHRLQPYHPNLETTTGRPTVVWAGPIHYSARAC